MQCPDFQIYCGLNLFSHCDRHRCCCRSLGLNPQLWSPCEKFVDVLVSVIVETETAGVFATVLMSAEESWPVERRHEELKWGMSQL